jgi:tetratricopeptide (TPR) repeat protein
MRELALLATRAAQIRRDQAAYRSAAAWTERAIDEASRAGADDALAEGRSMQLLLRAQRGEPWNAEDVTDTLTLIDRCGTQRLKAWTANTIGMTAYFAGQWDAARSFYAEAEEAQLRIGNDLGAAVGAANQGEILVQQGRSTEARAILVPALRTLVAAKATSFASFALSLLARAEMLDGEYRRAIDHLGEARALAVEMGETDEATSIQALAVECLVLCGDAQNALDIVEQARAEVAASLATLAAWPALERARSSALLAVGRAAEAHQVLRASLQIARDRGNEYETQASLAALLRAGAGVDAAESADWEAERAGLADKLGIVSLSTV